MLAPDGLSANDPTATYARSRPSCRNVGKPRVFTSVRGIYGEFPYKMMNRVATAIAKYFRYAFWTLAASILIVLLLQPIYFLSLASLDHVVSRQRIADHLSAAFDEGVLSDDGNPHRLIFKGGEQLT